MGLVDRNHCGMWAFPWHSGNGHNAGVGYHIVATAILWVMRDLEDMEMWKNIKERL